MENNNNKKSPISFYHTLKSVMFPPNQITLAQSMQAVSVKLQRKLSYLFPQVPNEQKAVPTPEQQQADNARTLLQYLTFN